MRLRHDYIVTVAIHHLTKEAKPDSGPCIAGCRGLYNGAGSRVFAAFPRKRKARYQQKLANIGIKEDPYACMVQISDVHVQLNRSRMSPRQGPRANSQPSSVCVMFE